MPACWRPRFLASSDKAVARRLDAWRAQPDRGGRQAPEGLIAAMADQHFPASAGRDDRHSRRRPARPHAGAGGGAARPALPRLLPGQGIAGVRCRAAYHRGRVRRRGRAGEIRRCGRRHHLRVRERAGRDGGVPRRAQAGVARSESAGDDAGPPDRKAVRHVARLRDGGVCRNQQRRRSHARARRRSAARRC